MNKQISAAAANPAPYGPSKKITDQFSNKSPTKKSIFMKSKKSK